MIASRKSSTRKFPKRLASESVIALCLIAWSGPAWAYRPFDGTDAAVAAPGELEIELQPAGRLHEGGNTTLVAPATVINYGLSEGWEAVFEGQGQTLLSPSGPTSLTSAGAFLKHVLQPGSLQGKTGPSVATEFGVLLPDSTGSSGVGASQQSYDSGDFGDMIAANLLDPQIEDASSPRIRLAPVPIQGARDG